MATSETMAAWRLDEFHEDPAEAIDALHMDNDVPIPQPKEGQILVNVKCTSLNPIGGYQKLF